MTAEQLSLFEHSAGVGTNALTLLIAGVGAVIFLTWGAWIASMQLQRWQLGQISFYDLLVLLVRAAVVMMLVGYLVR